MRITGGEARGRILRVPRSPGVRPTPERVREAIFSKLAPWLPGARVVDLFAGSGALGLEALSRGAASVVFVEQDPGSAALLAGNARALGYGDRVHIRREDVFRAIPNTIAQAGGRSGADLVFADPPYERCLAARVVQEVAPYLEPGAWLVLEHSVREAVPEEVPEVPGFRRVDQRRYGDTVVSYFRHLPEEGPA